MLTKEGIAKELYEEYTRNLGQQHQAKWNDIDDNLEEGRKLKAAWLQVADRAIRIGDALVRFHK